MTFQEPGAEDIENLYARIGTEAPHLCSPAIPTSCRPATKRPGRIRRSPATIADGMLYGRGAVDMKGGIACAVAAVLDHLAANGGKPDARARSRF